MLENNTPESVEASPATRANIDEEVEGLDEAGGSLTDYPIDDFLIRQSTRTVHDIIRRINHGRYVMDPEFQRDFIWKDGKQSRLIESVIMRIPLPVLYLAEDDDGRMIVVDGLQRLATFQRFVRDDLKLRLPARKDLNDKRFSELPAKIKNRIEDCNLILYIIDSKVADRARLDIFERVNSGEPLTRQQMRNSLYSGSGTRFLKDEADSKIFKKVTDESLRWETMRDREFVNRFCAFQLLGVNKYTGEMDEFLADSLRRMNTMTSQALKQLSNEFRRALANNDRLFDRHAFRKSMANQARRSPINASLWDVLSTGLSRYDVEQVETWAEPLRQAMLNLLKDPEFEASISIGTNDLKKVNCRFRMAHAQIREVLGDQAD